MQKSSISNPVGVSSLSIKGLYNSFQLLLIKLIIHDLVSAGSSFSRATSQSNCRRGRQVRSDIKADATGVCDHRDVHGLMLRGVLNLS